MKKFLIPMLFIVCAFFGTRGRAEAMIEYCPATVQGTHSFGVSHPGVFSFGLSAASDRTVSGDVVVQTSSGWFTFPFAGLHLAADTSNYSNAYVRFRRTEYLSQPIYVRFPSEVAVERAWVADAQSTGETMYGWDKQGRVTCQPPAGLESPVAGLEYPPFVPRFSRDDVKRETPSAIDVARVPTSRDVITVASLTTEPGSVDCKQPFAETEVRKPVAPDWPLGLTMTTSVTVLVMVAVSATGAMDDAWVYQPSGNPQVDEKALLSAKASRFGAGSALCQPAPGFYIFRAEFQPD